MIELDGYKFNVEIERKKIKNLYLSLINDTIKVRCPYGLKQETIWAFIIMKKAWIIKTYQSKGTSLSKIGETIYFLGLAYQLVYIKGANKTQVSDGTIILHAKDFDQAISNFYQYGKSILERQLSAFKSDYYAILKSYGYNNEPFIKYKNLKRSWGICYPSKNQIVLNRRLIHYPVECLKAVFLHECMHFILPNHSKRFHDLLEYHMPEYKKVMLKLR